MFAACFLVGGCVGVCVGVLLGPSTHRSVVFFSFPFDWGQVYDALSMNATCRDDPECGWVQGQCWSNKYCNSIGIAWSDDGVNWVNATHLAVQTPSTADAMCGLIRTPIGTSWLADWLVGWLAGWLAGWLEELARGAAGPRCLGVRLIHQAQRPPFTPNEESKDTS